MATFKILIEFWFILWSILLKVLCVCSIVSIHILLTPSFNKYILSLKADKHLFFSYSYNVKLMQTASNQIHWNHCFNVFPQFPFIQTDTRMLFL